MRNITISSNKKNMYTNISNDFIDKYISIDGNRFKVYIYLLSLTQRNYNISSMESIAIALSSDIDELEEALRFWQSEGVLSLSFDNNSNITGIIINDDDSSLKQTRTVSNKIDKTLSNASNKTNISNDAAGRSSDDRHASKKNNYDDIAANAVKALMPDQSSIQEVILYAERYLHITINESNKATLISIYDNLYGNVNLVEYLLMYAAENKKDLRYLEKTAIDWHEHNIRTINDAEEYIKSFNNYYSRVMRAFGIRGRSLADEELRFANTWYDLFSFNCDIIIEACNRTVKNSITPTFEYANSIIERWAKSHVTSFDDIQRLDEEHKKNTKSNYKKTATSKVSTKFHYENQREDIDFDEIEKRSLTQKYKPSNN